MRHYRTITAPPFHLHPLAVSALSPSTILPIFPSPSLLESTWNARRRRNTPPRSFARRRLYGEYAPPFLGPPSSSLYYASNAPLLALFGTPQRRRDDDLATPARGTSPFASHRRPELRQITSSTPSYSSCPPGHRHLLAVVQDLAGTSPDFSPSQRRPPRPPLTGNRGESPTPIPLANPLLPRGQRGPRPSLASPMASC